MLDWLRLVRLPNLATAAADSLAGFLICWCAVGNAGWPPAACWLAVAASVAFYAAGMVLNDVCDVETDCRERPERPLPSGAIAVDRAAAVGRGLLTAGSAAACGAAVAAGSPWPAAVGAALTACVWIYDRHAKATIAGPEVMGGCRGLNWLLGMTAAGGPSGAHQWAIPLGMAVYVAGITLYARDEAGRSRAALLAAGTAAMALGLAVAAAHVWLPLRDGSSSPAPQFAADNWLLLWSVLGASILFRAVQGVCDPVPARVRAAVGNAIMSIITLDAVLMLPACGPRWAIALLGLLALFLAGRRLVSPT
jgi:4-hydroxybenzoate polyprenyltransferase